jgi:hypothetical protein
MDFLRTLSARRLLSHHTSMTKSVCASVRATMTRLWSYYCRSVPA